MTLAALTRKEPPGANALQRAAHPLNLPSYCNGFHGFIRFVAECEFALHHFSIELESFTVLYPSAPGGYGLDALWSWRLVTHITVEIHRQAV